MIYSSNDRAAAAVMNRERLTLPEERTYICPICGAYEPDGFYIQKYETIGCTECIKYSDYPEE